MLHVIPYLKEEEEEEMNADGWKGDGDDEDDATTKKYTHQDFVEGALECLQIEEEMAELEEDDPEYLAQLEREALADEPELVAEIVADVLKQDEALLKDISSELERHHSDSEAVKEAEGMLGKGETLEHRPDLLGSIIARLLGDDQNLEFLEKFDEALSEHFFVEDDWNYEENDIGGGDEL